MIRLNPLPSLLHSVARYCKKNPHQPLEFGLDRGSLQQTTVIILTMLTDTLVDTPMRPKIHKVLVKLFKRCVGSFYLPCLGFQNM